MSWLLLVEVSGWHVYKMRQTGDWILPAEAYIIPDIFLYSRVSLTCLLGHISVEVHVDISTQRLH